MTKATIRPISCFWVEIGCDYGVEAWKLLRCYPRVSALNIANRYFARFYEFPLFSERPEIAGPTYRKEQDVISDSVATVGAKL